MKNRQAPRDKRFYMNCFAGSFKQFACILFLLLSTSVFAQQERTSGSIGFQAGINSGILGGGAGPSFSLHFATRTEKVIQLESMLFFDSHSGKSFLSGHSQKNVGVGFAGGLRINAFPQKNWNPSLLFMPGLMYSSQQTSRHDDRGNSGISPALCIGISNTFYRKHLVNIGINTGENITAAYLKYGFLF